MNLKYRDFSIDEDCVSNEQFKDFVESTNYVTEAELYGFVSYLVCVNRIERSNRIKRSLAYMPHINHLSTVT